MKTLIVYYSFTSNNEMLAKELQEKLGADLFRIETRKKRTAFSIMWDIFLNRIPEIKGFYHAMNLYDKYIFISPIWAGKIASPLKAFLLKERLRIQDYSFITVCGGGAPGQRDKIFKSLSKLIGHSPKQVVELWLKDFTRAQGLKPSALKAPVLRPGDLKFFKNRIDEFVHHIKERTLETAA